ncbi:hypothetical protein B5F53_11540 [Blautia sp. An249]|uniref:hypothetical protein n=1 Tax=Blautia sp. An249 TaxID=1965603 RepID=UPI000B3A02C8|nr:hypothetical protein [Blautia sp. An249]OUO78173.1 hypothetical protein B5F53_11540 [Blautia sp. An249]
MTEKEAIKRIKDHMEVHALKEIRAIYITQALNMSIKALKEIQQYRKIGTVKECRAAMKKQNPKKPVKRSFIIPYEGIDVCPNCKEPINKKEHHCKCGQAIEWSDEEC